MFIIKNIQTNFINIFVLVNFTRETRRGEGN